MNGQTRTDAADTVHERAIAWLVRLQSDSASAQDWAELSDWLEASPDNLVVFEEVERLSAAIDAGADQLGRDLVRPSAEIVPLRARTSGRAPRRFALPALVAASAAAVVAVSLLTWSQLQGRVERYRTGIGQTRDLTLADGSHVRLDADSQISVRLSATARQVVMGDGQASFDVAKDPNRPFLIRLDDDQIRVVGTEFNIRHYDGVNTITVRRGVVEFAQIGGAGPSFRLTRGDELRHPDGSRVYDRSSVDPDGAFAWAQGRLVADDQPLTEIARYLSRRYSVPVRVDGPARAARFSGVLVLSDEASTVRAFAQLTSRRATRTTDAFMLR